MNYHPSMIAIALDLYRSGMAVVEIGKALASIGYVNRKGYPHSGGTISALALANGCAPRKHRPTKAEREERGKAMAERFQP